MVLIMVALCLMLLSTHYPLKCAGVIGGSLTKVLVMVNGRNMIQ